VEADLAVFDDPDGELADRISGAIGELSSFDQAFGYHADGVGLETAILPAGWQARLTLVEPERFSDARVPRSVLPPKHLDAMMRSWGRFGRR
jgi:hypothetical protein